MYALETDCSESRCPAEPDDPSPSSSTCGLSFPSIKKHARKLMRRFSLSFSGMAPSPPRLRRLSLDLESPPDEWEDTWIVVGSPLRERRVFTEPLHCTSYEVVRPEATELMDLHVDAVVADVYAGAALETRFSAIESASRDLSSSRSMSGPNVTQSQDLPCLSPGSDSSPHGDRGFLGGHGAVKRLNRGCCHTQRAHLSDFVQSDLLFPSPKVLVGNGAFGSVLKAWYKGEEVAVKMIHQMYATDEMRKALQNELDLLSNLSPHENMVSLLGGCMKEEECYIVEELMDTDLHNVIHPGGAGMKWGPPPKPMPIAQVLQVGLDVTRGLAHLHPNILHRDLKPKNILMKNGVAKVADFGLSAVKKKSYLSGVGLTGTAEYISPEGMNGRINHKSDVYSLGILLWECITGLKPYHDYQNVFSILYCVGAKGARPDFPASSACPPALQTLVESCWSQDHHDRPDCAEIIRKLEEIKVSLFEI